MIRWGIAGSGFISHAMLKAIALSDGSRAVSVYGRNAETREALMAEYDIERGTDTLEALVADPEVDAIYIALPNHLHRMATELAVAAGKDVLCEKSLTTTVADAEALAEAVTTSGQFFVEGLMYTAHPIIKKLHAFLQRDDIGELRHVSGFYSADIWQVVNPAGKGTLYNLGCYPASLLHLTVQTMCGEEAFADRKLTALGNIRKDGNLQDTAATVRFSNGVLATLQSTDSYGMAHEFVIATTTGTIRFDTNPWLPEGARNSFNWVPYEGHSEAIESDDPNDAFYHQVKMVEANLLKGTTEAERPSPRLKDSLEIMAFLNEWEAAAS
ncbi:MAG: Gfo/Idh/MocA family oxidoreductase [Cognatishimia sp.]|uniref:Gfo/Idh/MocA family protein n=1 Tax=Cognatishimia sp. TaxID=2211648 RepID=UPI003B8D5F8C